MKLKQCYQPWLELQIKYDQIVRCCCYYNDEHDEWDFVKEPNFDLEKYWNGLRMQKIRGIIRNGEAKGTGCDRCQFVEYGVPKYAEKPPVFLNSIQKNNYRNAIKNFEDKRLQIESYPIRYYLQFGLACNIQCVMCSQAEHRPESKKTLPTQIFGNLEKYFQYAEQIAVIGGEPFVIPEARSFIRNMNESDKLTNVRLSIHTNGTLLDKYLNDFQKIRNINFCISLDSVGKTYEYIRKGAHWQKTEDNITTVMNHGKTLGNKWTVSIASVLMKSSLSNLIPYVQWCIQHDFSTNFVPITSNTLNREEDIFTYPQLLDDIPSWELLLDEAIMLFRNNAKYTSTAGKLEHMKGKLIRNYKKYKDYPLLFSSPELANLGDILASIGEENFLIWGTGSFYEINYSLFIRSYQGDNFKGFIDNDSKKWDKIVDGKKVYNPNDLKDMKPNNIIIASAMRNEIIEQIQGIGIDKCRVYKN